MRVKFWGVRGSIPSGNKETSGIGGNTTCVEVRCGEDLFILDTGTGIRNLGLSLMNQLPIRAKILYSHVHWDHIQGLPFFGPLYLEGNELDIYGGTSLPITIEEILHRQMSPPVFPVPMKTLPSTLRFHDQKPGDVIETDNCRVSLIAMYHPNGSYGYRFDSEGKSMVFATDVEHMTEDVVDPRLQKFCTDADVLIYDCQYTEDEYHGRNGHFPRIGWGHSTMNHGVKLAKAANVKQLILFHHDPAHCDDTVKKIESEARELFPKSTAAYEGLEIDFQKSIYPKSCFE